jgi:hypothetical protein
MNAIGINMDMFLIGIIILFVSVLTSCYIIDLFFPFGKDKHRHFVLALNKDNRNNHPKQN